ncbi:MAG: cytochrome b/b6 domain-containing protein [Nevskiales bacterium]|nr:cytochrome b/b6 domain-containing protein [Nevskiales bacterium]
MSTETQRYTAVAIVLHWAMAVALLGNLLVGVWMHDAIEVAGTQARAIAAFQLHKSLGLTILLLSLLRLGWRCAHTPPPLPAGMPAWEAFAARATHWAFYGLMIGLPLSGWLYVSTQWRHAAPLNVPTLWFGLFEVPHLFGLNQTSPSLRQSWAEWTVETHELLAWGVVVLLVLHVAAALKHHFLNRDAVLAHMVPWIRVPDEPAPPRSVGRRLVLAAGFAAILIGTVAFAWALLRPLPLSGAAAVRGESRITNAPEANWAVVPAASEITFSGEHAGVAFRGRFTRWQADLRFHPDDLARSRIEGRFETASATDGVPLHDESLPQPEWFDSARHPLAIFRSTGLVPRGENTYAVEGVLVIKNREIPVAPLTLERSGDSMTIRGRVEVDRRTADLGMESDPDAQYVSREIVVEVRVEARPNLSFRTQ